MHPFWAKDKGWVTAGELSIGDQLESKEGLLWAVDRIEWQQQNTAVYNITVKDFHTFYATSLAILTHNSECIPAYVYLKQVSGKITSTYKGSSPSKILDQELRLVAGLVPDPSSIKTWEAHHLVPANASKVQAARDARNLLTNDFMIDINSAANGMWLPKKPGFPDIQLLDWDNVYVTLSTHNGGHSKKYYEYVYGILENTYSTFGPAGMNLPQNELQDRAVIALNSIRQALMDGTVKIGRH